MPYPPFPDDDEVTLGGPPVLAATLRRRFGDGWGRIEIEGSAETKYVCHLRPTRRLTSRDAGVFAWLVRPMLPEGVSIVVHFADGAVEV